MVKIFASRVKIKRGKILNDHGLYAPFGMNSDIQCKIKLPKADEIMVAQPGQSVAEYTLEDVKLEYSTIDSAEMYRAALKTITDSEEYVFPNIKNIKTIEGIPNSVYSQGLDISTLFIEARKVFPKPKERHNSNY